MHKTAALLVLFAAVPLSAQQAATAPDSWLRLMETARAHARSHGATTSPVLSPQDRLILDGSISVQALHAAGLPHRPLDHQRSCEDA